jgi:calcineurin-like phosphoesterase family protein
VKEYRVRDNDMWFTSDTHYGHSNILEFCKRPFDDVAEMDEKLIAYHNELVKPEDTVYHLGDFAFASHSRISSILNRLNGTYRMLRGNHDKWMKKFKHPKIEWIKDYFEIREEGLVMFHYPLGSWNGMRRGSIMLHGHTR